jgi:hypothetical protein
VTQGTASTYVTDRFAIRGSVTSKFTGQQSSVAPAGFVNSLLCTSSSAYTVGAAEAFFCAQFIEGFNVADLGWGTANAATVTLSFWVRSSLTGTFGGSLCNYAGDRSYPFTYTINAANTWEFETITIPGDTTGTWPTNNNGSIVLNIGLGAGSTLSGTAGAWAGSLFRSATGAVSVVGTNGATFAITGVQLEKGSTATSFDYRPYGTELALCQRYYQRIAGTETTIAASGRWGANIIGFTLPTIVTLRAQPTISSSGNFLVVGNGSSESFTAPALGSWSGSTVTLIKSGLALNPSATAAYSVFLPGPTNFTDFASEL